jgi:hypothetical protein
VGPEQAELRPPEYRELRRFAARGTEWVARLAGCVSIGRAPEGVAPLILVCFAPSETPDAPSFEVLTVRRDLGDFGDAELLELLDRARPFSGSGRRQPLFSEIRAGKKGER